MKILLCQHGGSGNHGCEALARTSEMLLRKAFPQAEITLYSYRLGDDELYLRDSAMTLTGLRGLPGKFSPHNLTYHLKKRLLGPDKASKLPITGQFRQLLKEADLVVAIGGDNYCYQMGVGYYALDNLIAATGKPYLLLGASLEPADLEKGLAEHLKCFTLITAREPITYEACRKAGLKNVVYAPDSAFLLPCGTAPAVAGLMPENAVGINLGPLIMQSESAGGMALKNYQALVRRVLDTTDLQIALVPHVVWEGGDDRQPLTALYEQFKDTGRVFLVPDANCKDLKALISRLRFFIGARTHSTIAAYSTGVPTLVCGYSVKARGIALDLFGESEGYVVPVQGLEREDMLAEAFSALFAREKNIRDHLRAKLPGYQQQALSVADAIGQIKI